MGRVCPKWSLELVLDYLQLPTFQPESCSIRDLTMKSVFLVTLATAYRVSEIHSLAYTEQSFRRNQDGSLTLGTSPGFVAKNRRPSSGVQLVTLAPLPDNPSLCPVQTLQCYLDRTALVRGTRTALFLPLSNQRPRLTPAGLSTWIRCLISDAYRWRAAQEEHPSAGLPPSVLPARREGDLSRPVFAPPSLELPGGSSGEAGLASTCCAPPSSHPEGVCVGEAGLTGLQVGREERWLSPSNHPRPTPPGPAGSSIQDWEGRPDLHRSAHELRALASSLSLARGTALEDLLRAVGWRSKTTFAQFYLRDVGGPLDNRLPSILSLPGGGQ